MPAGRAAFSGPAASTLGWFGAACTVLEQAGCVSELVEAIVYPDYLEGNEPGDVPEGAGVSAAVALARLRRGSLDCLCRIEGRKYG